MKKNRILIALLFVFTFPVFAKTSALLIGINEYEHLDNLEGAVNDVNLIHDALTKIGVKSTLLINHKATKAAIYQQWFKMVAGASKGDTLIFTYSGHGGLEKDKDNEPNETMGYDQNFLLSKFSKGPSVKNANFRIVDDEIHDWFYKAENKGIKIIFVADSCYSGSMTRGSFQPGAGEYNLSDIDLPPPNLLDSNRNNKLVDDDLKHVVFFYSSSDKETTPEYRIDGKPHGLLSWAFANGISGKADINKDKRISKLELETYMREIILDKTHSIQLIGSKPKGSGDLVLFSKIQMEKKLSNNYRKPKLFIIGNQNIQNSLLSYQQKAMKKNLADLIWDIKKGIVINNTQDIIAYKIDSEPKMQAVLKKWQLLDFLQSHIIYGHFVQSELKHSRDPVHIGDSVKFSIKQIHHPFLTQFNLAGDGQIQFLYPTFDEDLTSKIDTNFELELEIKPPVGSDQLVSIFSDKPLKALHQDLANYDKSYHSLKLLKVLDSSLKKVKYQISTIDLYTVEK